MDRRQFNQALLSVPMALMLTSKRVLSKTNHLSLESLSPIGMGTWITFDHQASGRKLNHFIDILEAFFAAGGQMIDSSPMYGYAQQLLGQVLAKINHAELFAATKVWVPGAQMGIEQMQQSISLWGLEQMNLMYVHNLMDWQSHLPTLRQWQSEGKIKYTGVTTSHGRRHGELLKIMRKEPIDCVQFTYNINDREAEQYLLPMAADKGIKVVINRPFQTGGLFTRVNGESLPDWAVEIQCQTWAQFFLKFIISHPAVTCAIPATSKLVHMQENMQALKGTLPDQHMRKEMVDYFESVS